MKLIPVKGMLMALALSAPLAAAVASDEKPEFSEVDEDGDGAITVEEAVDAGAPEEQANNQDLNDDGELDESDWRFIQF
ncbi:MAG: hypothetical protein WD382_06000 [Halofilum sp. (in: g-proteobacteria)]